MATTFITVLYSVSVVSMDGWDPYIEGGVGGVFEKCWNKAVKEYQDKKELPEEDCYKYKAFYHRDFTVDGGNLHTVKFGDAKELPEDSFTFLNMLSKRLNENCLRVAVLDKGSRQREIFD